MFADRRKYVRIPVLLVGSGRAEGQVFEAVCTNVSPGGAFFSCKQPPPVGSFAMMMLKPFGADGPEVRCSLVVAWQAGRGSGHSPGFGGLWQEVTCTEGPAPVRLFAEDVLRLYGMDPQTAEDGSGVLRLVDRVVRPSQVMAAQPAAAVGSDSGLTAKPAVLATPAAPKTAEAQAVPGWNAPSGGAWRPASSATAIGLTGPTPSRGLAQAGRDLTSEGDFSDGERPPPTMPEVPNPGMRRASATWEAAQSAELGSTAARMAQLQRQPSGYGQQAATAVEPVAVTQEVAPGAGQAMDLTVDPFADADELADEDRGLPLDEDDGDQEDNQPAHHGRRDSEPSQSWDLGTGGTDPGWGEAAQEASSPAAEGWADANLNEGDVQADPVASAWTWHQPSEVPAAGSDTLPNKAVADHAAYSAPPLATTGAAVAAGADLATPAHGPTARELAAVPPWSELAQAASAAMPLARPHGRPSTDLYGASPAVHQASTGQTSQPQPPVRAKTGQVAGIRGRDLLQDSDTWLVHQDEVSDAELMALSAPPGPAAEANVSAPAAASSLDRLKSALVAKLGGEAVSGVESLLADFAAATTSGVGQPLRQVARPMAASQRVTAPSDATTAARARSEAALQGGAPVGDRTEVVDPRHMAQVLAQFGGPTAASGAVPRPATPGPMAAVAANPPGRSTGPAGNAGRGTGPTGVASAPRQPDPAATPAQGAASTGRHTAATPGTDALGRSIRDSSTSHGLRSSHGRPGTPATGTAAPSHLSATARSSSIDQPAVARSAATDSRLQATASDLASFRANLVDKQPAGLAAEAVAGWKGAGAVLPRVSTGADTKENRGGQARPTGTIPVAPMPSPEAVPLLPFGNLLPAKPATQQANQTASAPANWPGQANPAQAPTRPTLLPMVAAGVDVGSSGSQRAEATVAYTGQQADQVRDARRQTGALAEHTQHLSGGSNPVLVGRTGPAQVSQLQPVDPQLADWPADVPKGVSQRYDSLQQLGRGGHGVVYKARDRNLDRTVVLKFLASDQLGTEVARKYFLREVKLAASLSHPNILHIYDVAESGGVLYYVMEFIDGVTLSAYLPAGQPLTDYAFLFSVVQQLADALDHAHAAGVLHRDVKPENVLVGQDGIVKLFDFGLARVSHEDLTSEGSLLIGTPFYMAPEQLLGQAVDARADQYALGISLYRMLAGELPFRDGNVYAAHVLEPVPDPRRINARVPAAVVPVLERSLAKSPADRYANCKDLALDLWQALFGG
jgi:tRNA A-37 threonylcarbamoyl transferase component Bud32